MKPFYFAHFYEQSTGYVEHSSPPRFDGPKRLIQGCGSDARLYLDGRLSLGNMHKEALQVCKSRRWKGYDIQVGDFLNSSVVARLVTVD